MGRARDLWEACQDLVRICEAHPFVQGIASGALPRERFAFYVGQDAFFLDAFARAYALAFAKAPDREAMADLRALLEGTFEELRLHQGYAARWGISLAPEPAPATRAYTDFLLRVAALEPAGHIVAAMTPCMRLYAYLGRTLRPFTDPASPYREWVETYASDAFEALARRLEGLLDRLPGEEAVQQDLYRTAMTLEVRFFDAAYGR